jgi:hypothetical protein
MPAGVSIYGTSPARLLQPFHKKFIKTQGFPALLPIKTASGTMAALLREAVPSTVLKEVGRMWNWFNCYLSGRHEFGVSCEPGAIFLRCSHCGRRSAGWAMDTKSHKPAAPPRITRGAMVTASQNAAVTRRALPFSEAAAS